MGRDARMDQNGGRQKVIIWRWSSSGRSVKRKGDGFERDEICELDVLLRIVNEVAPAVPIVRGTLFDLVCSEVMIRCYTVTALMAVGLIGLGVKCYGWFLVDRISKHNNYLHRDPFENGLRESV